MKYLRVGLILVSSISLAPALAAEPVDVQLQGSVHLDEEGCAKGTGEAGCQLNFEVTGKAAKVLYDGMTSEGVLQECTGEIEKFDESGMHCIKGETAADYFCDFAYSFKEGTFAAGGDGC